MTALGKEFRSATGCNTLPSVVANKSPWQRCSPQRPHSPGLSLWRMHSDGAVLKGHTGAKLQAMSKLDTKRANAHWSDPSLTISSQRLNVSSPHPKTALMEEA